MTIAAAAGYRPASGPSGNGPWPGLCRWGGRRRTRQSLCARHPSMLAGHRALRLRAGQSGGVRGLP